MIKLMFEMQPRKKTSCLEAADNMGLTPLHTAAMFDRTQTVEYLIEEVKSSSYRVWSYESFCTFPSLIQLISLTHSPFYDTLAD